MMLAGYLHKILISVPGSEYDHLGQPCPLIVGSDRKENYHMGCGILLAEDRIESVFCDSNGTVSEKTEIRLKK